MEELGALSEFARNLRPGARVLLAGLRDGAAARLHSAGYALSGFDEDATRVEEARRLCPAGNFWRSDYHLLKLETSYYDGLWANHELDRLPPPGCQRALASFFPALRPRAIALFTLQGTSERREEPELRETPAGRRYLYHPEDFSSLLRQNGFQVVSTGKSSAPASGTVAFVARRL